LYLPEPAQPTIDELLDGFDPYHDKIDKQILYEITGRKHEDLQMEDDEDMKGKAFE